MGVTLCYAVGVAVTLHCSLHRRLREQARGVQYRQRRVLIVHDERNLGAAEHHGVTARISQPPDDLLMGGDRMSGSAW
jgi:hypothetical protein